MFEQYASLPKKVWAVQFTEENKDQVLNSLTGQFCPDFEEGKPTIQVTTIHGEVATVRIGDWIVKDAANGTYYPVKDEIFRDGYV